MSGLRTTGLCRISRSLRRGDRSGTMSKTQNRTMASWPWKPEKNSSTANLTTGEVIYKIIEELKEWKEKKAKKIEKEKMMSLATLSKMEILHQYVFRKNNPSIFGVKILTGIAKQNTPLIDETGKEIARIKAIQKDNSSVEKAAENASGPVKGGENFRMASGMQYIPFDSITDGVKRFGNQDPFKPQKEAIAQVCRDLNVDAVAIVYVRMSYRYGKAAGLKVGENVKGIGRIGSEMMLVNKDGKVVAQTGEIRTKLLDDFETDSLSLVRGNKMLLDTHEVRSGYEQAISASAQKMNEVLVNAFEKLK